MNYIRWWREFAGRGTWRKTPVVYKPLPDWYNFSNDLFEIWYRWPIGPENRVWKCVLHDLWLHFFADVSINLKISIKSRFLVLFLSKTWLNNWKHATDLLQPVFFVKMTHFLVPDISKNTEISDKHDNIHQNPFFHKLIFFFFGNFIWNDCIILYLAKNLQLQYLLFSTKPVFKVCFRKLILLMSVES